MEAYGSHYEFNIRVLYYSEPTPKLRIGFTTDDILWNVITLCYHEYFDELEEMKKTFSDSQHFMALYVCNCINFALNEMTSFCNAHKVPSTRHSKKGEMIPLSIDEYPIWFNNLEDFIAELTWGKKNRKIMMTEVLTKMLNKFTTYSEVIESVDFSIKDSSELEFIINEVISKFPDKVNLYKNGKTGLLNMLFGEVMKSSGGKINTGEAKEMLERKLRT